MREKGLRILLFVCAGLILVASVSFIVWLLWISNLHFWVWINEPQHGSAVQALTSGLGAMFAFFAVVFTRAAYLAAKRQANAADAQTQVAKDQLERERLAYAEEQRVLVSDQVEKDNRARVREDIERPRFDICQLIEEQRLMLYNAGLTSAIGLSVVEVDSKSMRIYVPVCNPGQQFLMRTEAPLDTVHFRVTFRSMQGIQWKISTRFDSTCNAFVEETVERTPA